MRAANWSWQALLFGSGTAVAPPPAAAPRAPRDDAELPPRAEVAGGAGAGLVPSPCRTSPRLARPSPPRGLPPPAPLAPPPARRPLAPTRPEGLDTDDAARLPLRSLAALRATEDDGLAERLRALGVPTGPWTTDETAKAAINVWARDRGAAGGGFTVVWGSLKPAVIGSRNARGRLHLLICHNHAEAKGKCKWSLTLEECQEGWAVRSFHPHDLTDSGHNHDLITTAVEARARSSMREIPADLVEIGKALVRTGIPNAQVFRFLKDQAETDGGEALFTRQDVYHACGASTGERRLDATHLVEMLQRREVDEGLFQRVTTEDDCLKEVFFVLQGATEIYANEPERQVVEIDHKARHASRLRLLVVAPTRNCLPRPARCRVQHGTNKHGLKMMLWITVDGSGATKILACGLMMEESLDSVAWCFRCFSDAFRVPPRVIFSDGAPAFKAAIEAVFPTAMHLWCIWHLSNNMVTNLKPACGADNDLWRRVSSKWWQIAKQTDESSRATFDAEWAALGAMLGESTATGASMATARAWLAKSAVDREHWAYRWTWRYFTLGLHSTQRIEAVHSAITHFLRASTLLTNLLPQLESYTLDVSNRASVREYRFIQRLLRAADECVAHPFIAALAKDLTAYAHVLFKAQLQQSQFYGAVGVPGEEGVFTVTRHEKSWGVEGDAEAQGGEADFGISASLFTTSRRTTLTACSCQFLICYGMPCRHMLILYILQQRVPSAALFDPRWRQRLPAAVLAAEEALLMRRPPRVAGGSAAQPLDRGERYALILAAGRGVAAVGAETAGGYATAMNGLTRLLSELRLPAAGPAPARRARAAPRTAAAAAAAGAAAEGGGGAAVGPTCRSCWGMLPKPHYRSNKLCPNYGKPPLPEPSAHAMPRTVRGGGEALGAGPGSSEEDDSAPEDGNENVCHHCSEAGKLLECDYCPHSWHDDCLPLAARPGAADEGLWMCPVCAHVPRPVGFIAAPRRAPPGRGGGQGRKRMRPATEGSGSQRARNKAAGRDRELRFRGP